MKRYRCLIVVLVGVGVGCGAEDPLEALDFAPVLSGGKADGHASTFIAEHLISDQAFFDTKGVTVEQLQALLEHTPYETRSFLADLVVEDRKSFAQALHDESIEAGVNPLVMLVTLQKESSIVSRTKRPSRSKLDYALGCGCPDDRACMKKYRGLDKQIGCAAQLIQRAKQALDQGRATVSGRRPGRTMETSDGVSINLANKATTILYTYTPWVLYRKGGNWLFWNIWRLYSKSLGYERGLEFPFNEGWIGGACEVDGDCFFSGGRCHMVGDQGTCTRSCITACPDRDRRRWLTTFCVSDDDAGGMCVTRCDAEAESSCPASQQCVARERHKQPWVTRDVCMQ